MYCAINLIENTEPHTASGSSQVPFPIERIASRNPTQAEKTKSRITSESAYTSNPTQRTVSSEVSILLLSTASTAVKTPRKTASRIVGPKQSVLKTQNEMVPDTKGEAKIARLLADIIATMPHITTPTQDDMKDNYLPIDPSSRLSVSKTLYMSRRIPQDLNEASIEDLPQIFRLLHHAADQLPPVETSLIARTFAPPGTKDNGKPHSKGGIEAS